MENRLGRNYGFLSLLKFSLPTIIMMVFTSLYMIVDGMFVTWLIGTTALAAVNIVFPIVSIVIAVGVMLGTGGSAVVARKMGEKKHKEACQDFTRIVMVGVLIGIMITVAGLLFLKPILLFLGANDATYQLCVEYITVLLGFTVFAVLQMVFQSFFVAAGKPDLGLAVTILGGLANIVLDYLFIAKFHMGVAGVAWATGIGYTIPAITGLIWFSVSQKKVLHFVKPVRNKRVLFETFTNGSSEMVTNLAGAIITLLFNIMMARYLGEDGIAAITVVLYEEFILTAIYLGYSSGIAPIISFNYGENNVPMLKRLFRISMAFLIASSIIGFFVVMIFTGQMVRVFVPEGSDVYMLAVHGFRLYGISLLFKGVNIFASSLFTALSNGKVSAFLSLMRTFVFIALGILFLPYVWEVNGIWLAVPIAEILSISISVFFFKKQFKTWNERK
ncbi:putative MATE family efflux protein [Aequitasia blattaphilus]|uniref:Multidrug export protein MepA n=1 Tax=Aequitasia blattaphilus TaxID=2949332 RepID=A0ABT1EDG0_9FIRM|nr:MATE family efflux transporter [Aequitasia blattaphilus]MCP1102992.1 MATE family efflux transporter [Aequitasia blattaphilus]MCR8615632.1 MATE family efflux transporter [Aequitasia blattaphilus]